MTRSCGGCTKCCEVVPVKEIGLAEYTRCPKLRDMLSAKGPGCGIYTNRPYSCRAWSCAWLTSPSLPDELRPDKSGVIVDEIVDMISAKNQTTGKRHEMTAAQIWVVPGYEDAYHNPDIGQLILVLIDRFDAVLWRMKDGTARTFLRDPATGNLGMSAATPATPDAERSLGSTGERMWKAMQLVERRRGRGK